MKIIVYNLYSISFQMAFGQWENSFFQSSDPTLREVPGEVKFTETERGRVVTRSRGEGGTGSYRFMTR